MKASLYQALINGESLPNDAACGVYLFAIQRLLDTAAHCRPAEQRLIADCASEMLHSYNWDEDETGDLIEPFSEIVDQIEKRIAKMQGDE